MKESTIHISGEGEIFTYAWMWKNAKKSIKAARETEEGQFFNVMNTLVYSAFAMESFFNHLGSRLIDNWDKKERKLSKIKKLKLFLSNLKVEADLTTRPYVSVTDVFKFRDLIAHGRTEIVSQNEEVILSEDDLKIYMIENDWMKLCNIETAERVFVDVESIIHTLFKAAGMGKYPFMHFHSCIYSTNTET